MHDRLRGKFNNFAQKCLLPEEKRDCGLVLTASPLILPGDDKENEMFDDELGQKKM
jgi:hypothetical protein